MKKKNDWIDDEKYLSTAPCETYAVNMMRLVKDIFTKPDWDAIAKEAYDFAKREGEEPRRLIAIDGRPSDIMREMWNNTNEVKGKTRNVNGPHIQLKRNNGYRPKGASAGPRRFSQHIGSKALTYVICSTPILQVILARDICVALHEAVHVAQNYSYNPARIGGKRRPHDLMFNRMMLMLAKPYLGLTEKECNPFNMGYSVGNGYAPTRRMTAIAVEIITGKRGDGLPRRVLKHSCAPVEVVEPTEPTEEEKVKKQVANAKRQLKAIIKRNWEVGGDDCFIDDLLEMEEDFDEPCWREATEQVCNKLLDNDMHISCLTDNEAKFFEWIYNDAEAEWNPYNWDSAMTSPARERGLTAMYDYINREIEEPAVEEEQSVMDFSEVGTIYVHKDWTPKKTSTPEHTYTVIQFVPHAEKTVEDMLAVLDAGLTDSPHTRSRLVDGWRYGERGWPVPCIIMQYNRRGA